MTEEERDEPAEGGKAYLDALYSELRDLARARLAREGAGHTLQPTALVHEAYLRLLDGNGQDVVWDSEAHFFGSAARAMRRILIDHARAKKASKRGGDRERVEVALEQISMDDVPDLVLELDPALQRFAEEAPEKAELVTLRFYAGLGLAQAAQVLGISTSTADRYWAYAKAWLLAELRG